MVEEFVNFDNPMIEFVKRTNKNQKREKGEKKDLVKAGVLVAGVDPRTSTVCVGFSLCHRQMDEFDVVKTQEKKIKVPGFGVDVAFKRALKWQHHQQAMFISTPKAELKQMPGVVFIPASLEKPAKDFIKRCVRFYQNAKYPDKNKKLPEWTKGLQ
jgi:hypothetical protein